VIEVEEVFGEAMFEGGEGFGGPGMVADNRLGSLTRKLV